MSATTEPRPSRQQLAEALDKLAEWFPEEKPSLKKNSDAIILYVLEGTAPGARFSKLPVITGPVKLFCFPFQREFQRVSKLYSKVIS